MRAKTMNKLLCVILSMTIVFGACFVNVLAASDATQGFVRLDISGGKFAGNKAVYTFVIPSEWKNYVYVNRVVLGDDTDGVLEHLNFYCKSDSGLYKPALMFSLYVYPTRDWNENAKLDVILKSQSYVFAVQYHEQQIFKYESDKKVFNMIWETVKKPDDIKKLIQLPQEPSTATVKRVYINNVSIDRSPIYTGGVYFIPLRDVCETLGYTVNWLQNSSTVEIVSSNGFRDSFRITSDTTADKRGIKMHIRRDESGDRTYVQTAYITQVLKKSVEIDEDGNVYIYR